MLRGSGSGVDGTVIRVTGAPHRVFTVGGTGTWQPDAMRATVTDTYVPAGASHRNVSIRPRLRVGDRVVIQRPVTEAWIRFMSMDTLVRDGKPQTWIKAGTIITTIARSMRRSQELASRSTCRLSDSFDAAYLNPPGTTVVKYTFPGRIEQVGVESLRVIGARAGQADQRGAVHPASDERGQRRVGARRRVGRHAEQHDIRTNRAQGHSRERAHSPHDAVYGAGRAGRFRHLRHADSARSIERHGPRRVARRHPGRRDGPERRASFQKHEGRRRAASAMGDRAARRQQRVHRRHRSAAEHRVLESRVRRVGPWLERWLGGRVEREGELLLIQQPPGAKNWCIGCSGRFTPILWHGKQIPVPASPSETHESPGVPVTPASLYLAQLRDRLGEQALRNIGR